MRTNVVVLLVCVASLTAGFTTDAAAIGLCEQVTRESKVIAASKQRKHLAILRVEEQCQEHNGNERRTIRASLRIVDRYGKQVWTIALKDAQSTNHPYLRRHGFKPVAAGDVSPNKRCTISGSGPGAAVLRVAAGTRILYSKKLRTSSAQLKVTPYWFKPAKLLALHVKTTTNPGHYAAHSTSEMVFLPGNKHGLHRCY